MTYQEVLKASAGKLGPHCKACPVCNGKACKNTIPGPGAKGSGSGFIRSYDKWQEILVNLDTIAENTPVDTSFNLFGKTYDYPFFAAPIAGLNLHYGDKYNDEEFNSILAPACADAGICAFTGDGLQFEIFAAGCRAIERAKGCAIPTIKPWSNELVFKRIDAAKAAGATNIAMDIDGAGLPFLKNLVPPAGRKTVEDLRELIEYAQMPFILKGIMTVRGALKALEAGASGIVVSNHGGRVLDQCPAPSEVLSEISDAVDGEMTVFVDGGIRSGVDVFKAIALGADAVLIGRPFVNMVFGDQEAGVKTYVDKIGEELRDTMEMCGVHNLSEINRDCIFGYKL